MSSPLKKKQRPKIGNYLKPRDVKVLETLSRCRLLRESSLHRLCFPTVKEQRNVQSKLKSRFVEREYVGRRFPPIIRGDNAEFIDYTHQGRREAVYFLGPEGAALLRQDYDPNLAQVKLGYLYHRLDIADIRACLELALSEMEGVELERWVDEHDKDEDGDFILHDQVTIRDKETGKHKRLNIRPDACFILEEQKTGKQDFFFLEVDEGTESGRKRFYDKVLAYCAYMKQGFEESFGFEGVGFRVLTVCRSERGKDQAKRKANLVSVTHEAGGRRQFWFATFDQVMPEDRATGAHILHSPIWKRVDAELKEPEIALIERLFGRDR